MADGGLSIGLLIASTVASTGAAVVAQESAANAAEAQAENQQNLLDRRQQDQRQTLIENTTRLQANKSRQLAQLRASQAAGGFRTDTGTPLAMFGEIESQLDDEINQVTNRALDAIGQTKSQKANIAFGESARKSAMGINRLAIGVNAATKFGAGYGANFDRTGSDPFKIFS